MKDGNADFSIAKGISIGSSENEVKDAFGEPVYVNFGPNKYSIYLDKDPDKLSVFIDYYDDKCAGIRLFAAGKLKNEPTDTNTAVPPCVTEYEAPAELGNNIKSGRFELFDGMIVQLPAPLSLFIDNGWTTDADLSLYLMSGKTRGCILSKDGVTIRVYATNVGEWQNIFRNAMVTEILVVQSADEVRTIITLPGGVCTGATFDELEDILPQDSFRVYETDGYLVYDHTPSYKDLTAVVGEVQFKFDKESAEKRCCEIYIRYNFR
jgi:hypothetical protein